MPSRPSIFALLLTVPAIVLAVVPAIVSAVVPVMARAADLSPACQALFSAMEKSMTADHSTSTTRAGKTTHGVTSGGVNYIQVGGAWRRSPLTPQDTIAQSRENLKDAKSYTCSALPDSVLNGVPVANYAARQVNEDETVESRIAVSKSTGRMVQVENDIPSLKDARYVTQYSYDNVKAPM